MNKLQKFLILFVLTTFAFSTVASTAAAACNCSHQEMGQQAMNHDDMKMHHSDSSEMPCHGMDKAEKTAKNDSKAGGEKDMAKCDGCNCGHCNITTPAALPGQISQQQRVTVSKSFIAASDHIESLFPYGIDYPPKRLS